LAVDGSANDERPTTNDKRPAWYAIWTRSHCERQVAEQLAAKGFTAFLPDTPVRSRRHGAAHIVRVPMFPGYLFVRDAMEKSAYVEILKARGAVRILEDGWTRLTPIPDAEIDAVQRLAAADLPIAAHPHLREGDRVRVEEGPLAGVEGVFVLDKPNRGRLVLSIGLLGRSVAVEVDDTHVTPCAS